MIDHAYVLDVFDYNPDTGVLLRKFKNGSTRKMKPTGPDRSIRARLFGKDIRGHRLIWFYVHGTWPDLFIDHINGDPSDNRLCNLRLATDAENKRNVGKRSHNTSGVKGVTWDKVNNKWLSHATYNGKGFNLGRYTNIEDAAAAYRSFAKANYGVFYREDSP